MPFDAQGAATTLARTAVAEKMRGGGGRVRAETPERFRYTGRPRRGTQVGRERSAKPSFVGSIPTRASNRFPYEIRACGILNLPCTRRVPRIREILREGVAFPRFPEVRLQLFLPGLGPRAVVLLRYSN